MMTRFELNGTIYESNEKGNYFYKSTGKTDKKGNPVMMRIGGAIFEQAFDEYTKQVNEADEEWDAEEEIKERKNKQAESDKEAEDKMNKKKTKKTTRKSKNIAYEGNGITLTEKQVTFLKEITKDDFYENGLDSSLWIDVLCDTLAGIFNAMAVGAMVSTLREKDIIYVAKDKVNGKYSKFFGFTELGKQVAEELGLN